MQIRPSTQNSAHQLLIDLLEQPIKNSPSSLQHYLLRNVCTHALKLQRFDFIRTLLHRFDFLDQYERQYGLSQISYFWPLMDSTQKGTDYQEDFQNLWSERPSRRSVRHAILLIELFSQLRWHAECGIHLQTGLEWLEPHQHQFAQGYKRLKKAFAFHQIDYGNMFDGITGFQAHLSQTANSANAIILRFTQTLTQPNSKEKTIFCKSLLDELRTLPPATINRFRGEQMIIPHSFETIEEKEQALTDLETIIPFQKHHPDDLRTQIEKMYFDMYLEAKRYKEALDYGQRVLQSSMDMSLHTRQILQLKVDRCRLYLIPIEDSLHHFDTRDSQIQHQDDPKLIEEWQQFTLSLATLATKHYAALNNLGQQTIWQQRRVDINRTTRLKLQRLSTEFNLPFGPKITQRLALDLYQLGVLYDKLKATSKAMTAFQESSDLFESIQGPKRPLYAKQWANVLWKVHYRTDTEDNRNGLSKCLMLRERLQQNGTKGLNYALVTVRNTLGTWALRREEWTVAQEHHAICLTLIDALIQAFPEKKVYSNAQYKIRVRLAWSLYHLGEHDQSLDIASIMDSSTTLTNETLFAYLQEAMANL